MDIAPLVVLLLWEVFLNYYGVYAMSVISHIDHLQAKHEELDVLLKAEMAHPSLDFFAIKEMKKQKLLLKEEITRLTRELDHDEKKDAS